MKRKADDKQIPLWKTLLPENSIRHDLAEMMRLHGPNRIVDELMALGVYDRRLSRPENIDYKDLHPTERIESFMMELSTQDLSEVLLVLDEALRKRHC